MDARVSGNLGEILLRENLITAAQLEQARREQVAADKSLARVLVEMGIISEKVKLGILQKKLGCDIVSLRGFVVEATLAARVPRTLALRHHLVPFRVDPDGLVVAMDDPSDLEALDKIAKTAGLKIKPALALGDEITNVLEHYPSESDGGESTSFGFRLVRGLVFWVLLLLPVVVSYLLLVSSNTVQRWLTAQQLTEFDFAIYALLTYSLWSVTIYYIHDMTFNWLANRR